MKRVTIKFAAGCEYLGREIPGYEVVHIGRLLWRNDFVVVAEERCTYHYHVRTVLSVIEEPEA